MRCGNACLFENNSHVSSRHIFENLGCISKLKIFKLANIEREKVYE